MSVSFRYSAPGKIILFGEHAVVHGFPAVASAISKRMSMTAHLNPSTATRIEITTDGEHILSFNPYDETPKGASARESMIRAAFAQSFPQGHTLTIALRNGFRTDHGFGSSAAFSALLATAAMRANGHKIAKPTIFQRTHQLEHFFHSNSSGIDPATVVYGGALKMQKGNISRVEMGQLPLLLVHTGVKRGAGSLVSHVGNLVKKFPGVYLPMLSSLGEMSNVFCTVNDQERKNVMERFFPIAHNILKSMDLSCPEIEDIVKRAAANGMAAKFSGAGGGGIVLVTGENVSMKKDLFAPYDVDDAVIGAEGLREE